MEEKFKTNGDKSISHDKINAKLGITNKKIHTTFYLEGSTFITPKDEFQNYSEILNEIESSCKFNIKKKLLYNKNLSSNFLMNFEVSSDRMKKDKNTFLSFQYHFKQKNNGNTNIFTIKKENYDFFKSLLSDIENEMMSYNIKINKNKKVEVC